MLTLHNARYACILMVCVAVLCTGQLFGGSFKIQMGGSVVDDARITSYQPFFNGGNDPWGNVTYFSSNGNAERFYIRIPIPALLDSTYCDSISQVNLKLYFNGLQAPDFRICAQEVIESWNEQTINWNNKPQNDTLLLDTLTLHQVPVWTTFRITGAFKHWLCGDRANNGVLVRATHEAQGEQNTSVCTSSDDTTARAHRPLLEIVSPRLPDTLITDYVTSVNTLGGGFPRSPDISQNYPNPFNPSTTIKYELPRASQVTLTVYDILGREVSVLVNERKNAGVYEVKFDGSRLSSGMYYYRIIAGDYVASRKMLILK